jgi:hypothetical protein
LWLTLATKVSIPYLASVKLLEMTMLPRHANELLSLLEQVADVGSAVVRKQRLLQCYGQERQTVGIWRDIQEKWEETLDQFGAGKDVPLLVGDGDGVWTFAWGEGLILTDKSWFKDVAVLAKRKSDAEITAAA